MRLERALLLLTLAAVVSGCNGSEPPSWTGPPQPPPSDGILPIEGFEAYRDAIDAPWERSLTGIATMYALPAIGDAQEVHAEFVTSDPDGNSIVSVTVRPQDDSVREMRYVLSFDPRADGTFDVVSAVWTQRCHARRGHQGWSHELCV